MLANRWPIDEQPAPHERIRRVGGCCCGRGRRGPSPTESTHMPLLRNSVCKSLPERWESVYPSGRKRGQRDKQENGLVSGSVLYRLNPAGISEWDTTESVMKDEGFFYNQPARRVKAPNEISHISIVNRALAARFRPSPPKLEPYCEMVLLTDFEIRRLLTSYGMFASVHLMRP